MVKKGKLLAALDAHKGRDFEAEKRKKQVKDAEKRKRKRSEAEDEGEDDEEQQRSKRATKENGNGNVTSEAASESAQEAFEAFSSDNAEDDEDDEPTNGVIPQPDSILEASASEAEDESDLALSDLSEEDREDIVPHQRMTINNGPALIASRNRIAIVSTNPNHPFHHHNSLVSSDEPADTLIPDAMDDETRELMFYKIARDATVTARSLLKKEKIPFSRPADYFAEMVKTDDHMDKVKKKLYDEAASKKAAQEARRLRDAKKFGKKVQVAKEQERAKDKRDTLNKIQELKRKRKDTDTGLTNEPESLFQEINVDSSSGKPTSTSNDASKRQKRDSKYGFGGKKKYSKSGTAESSGDLSGFSARRMKDGGGERGRGRGRGGGRGGGERGRGGGRGGAGGMRGGRGGRGGARGAASSRGRGAAMRPGRSRRVGGRD